MKHLMITLVVLCVLTVPEAMAQRSVSPRIQELVDASEPLKSPLAEYPSMPPADQAYAPEAPPADQAYAPEAPPADQAHAPEAPPADQAYPPGTVPGDTRSAAGAVPVPPLQAGNGVPMAPSFGGAEGQWGQYQPPDYEDGLTSVGPCCETCGGGFNCPDIWTIRNRVRVWQRSKPRLITISGFGDYVNVTDPDTGDVTQQFQVGETLGTRSATFDVAPGYGVTARRYWRRAQENSDLCLEGVYFGLNHWFERRGVNATAELFTTYFDDVGNMRFAGYGNLFTPFTDVEVGPTTGFAGFDRAERHEFTYESEINNVEVNLRMTRRPRPDRIVLHPNGRWRRQCQPGIYSTSIWGIRYFSLKERFNFLGTGTTDIYDQNGNLLYSVDGTGTYDIKTYNDLLGLQFGLEMTYRHCLWGWGAEAKVCPCINMSRQRSRVLSSVTDPGDPFSGTLDESRFGISDDLALVGDVSLMAYYKVRPTITLRASWDMTWVVGVALAPEQLQWATNPAPRVNNNGTVFYQGVSLGIEWTR